MRAQSLLTAVVLLCSLANCLPQVSNGQRDVDSVAEIDEESGLVVTDGDGKGSPPSKGGGGAGGGGGGGERSSVSLVSILTCYYFV
jgi:hypothetical protein